MRRKGIWISVAVLLLLNGFVMWNRTRKPVPTSESRLRTTLTLAAAASVTPLSGHPGFYNSSIGGHYWQKELTLAPAQADAIMLLDGTLGWADTISRLADADYYRTNPADYSEYYGRSRERHQQAKRHATELVSKGLLMEDQAAFVRQRQLTGRSRYTLAMLRSQDVQELLGITKTQIKKLERLANEYEHRVSSQDLMSPDDKTRDEAGKKQEAAEKEIYAKAEKVLTDAQREELSRLMEKRSLPAEPPGLVAAPKDDAARAKLEEASPIFRALTNEAKSLALTADQQKCMDHLRKVVYDGLKWIGLEKSNRTAQRQANFLKHAEEFALVGILTQHQAKKIQDVLN